MQRLTIRGMWSACAGVSALVLAACGGNDLSIGATPTTTATSTVTPPPPTATVTRTPTPRIAQVAGLVVASRDVQAGRDDGLNALPPEMLPPVGKGFDRGLGHAEWVVDDGAVRGATDADGRFTVTGLTPGRHALRFTKTVDGNLMEFVVPIAVGDDGAAEVVAEVSWGLVRATSTYTEDGSAKRAVFAPNGTYAITREGRIAELYDGWRTLIDGDGDGRFDPQSCGREMYACGADGACASPEDFCTCVASCPACQDCPQRACVPRSYFHRPTCGPDGLCGPLPYQCGGQSTCAAPGDVCTCVGSCYGCDNCAGSACVAPCAAGEPIDIDRIDVFASPRLVVGQEALASANAVLSDGTGVDVTWLAVWSSTAPALASVDSWGRVSAIAAGAAELTATLGGVVSAPARVDVVERPTLLRIHLQNASCYYPLADPTGPDVKPVPPEATGWLPPPWCQQVVRIGAIVRFLAVGEFDTGYVADITDEVSWRAEPAAVGTIETGAFTATGVGAARITAALGAVTSDAQEVRVVDRPTIVALSVYPSNFAYNSVDGGPLVDPARPAPCFECGYALTVLSGDAVQFSATAHYETGDWEDVSERVTWRTSDAAVLAIDATGRASAAGAGTARIDASLDEVTSSPAEVRVVEQATLQYLSAYPDAADRVVAKDAQAIFHAVGFYDIGFSRDVTSQATWHSSDEAIGGFGAPGVFTGRAAGDVTVWAELDGVRSEPLPMEVFATSALDYCDPANVNRGTWSDDFNRVTLESDCAAYRPPAIVELRFTVAETQRPGGIFDPCLDLYAYRGDELIRTIREEGCGDPFLAPTAPGRDEAAPRYQLKAFWDLKDEAGRTVPAGTYAIRGRFYLYYDPIVSVDVTVTEPPAP
ncbi:MAG: Ig domain-containing protein [Candidatus Binatia bacterium]